MRPQNPTGGSIPPRHQFWILRMYAPSKSNRWFNSAPGHQFWILRMYAPSKSNRWFNSAQAPILDFEDVCALKIQQVVQFRPRPPILDFEDVCALKIQQVVQF